MNLFFAVYLKINVIWIHIQHLYRLKTIVHGIQHYGNINNNFRSTIFHN
jgi:hypothetical protein